MIYKREQFVEESPDNEKYPVKSIEQLTPVDGSGTKFVGRVSIGLQTPMGVQSMPVSFEIEAETIEGAFAKFEARAETEVDRSRKDLEAQLHELRRREQSRIVTPGEISPGGMGKLQL